VPFAGPSSRRATATAVDGLEVPHLDPLVELGLASPGDLPQPGDPWLHGEPPPLPRVVGRDLVISTQVLTEFYAVVTRKLAVPVSSDDAEAMVRQLSDLPVVAIDSSLVVSAIAGSRAWQVSIWDALILRAAEVAGCRRVLSEDLADGATYGSVVVENPFASR
jgi:predicted nucleic acid-binding protein